MARTGDPHSANSQFFINVVNNVPQDRTTARLDPNKKLFSSGSWGYTVFGSVIEGMEVVDKIVACADRVHRATGASDRCRWYRS